MHEKLIHFSLLSDQCGCLHVFWVSILKDSYAFIQIGISLSQPSSYFDDLLSKILPIIKVITSEYFLAAMLYNISVSYKPHLF